MSESLIRRVASALLGLESLSEARTATRPHATMRLTQKRPRTACDGRGHGHQEVVPMTRKKVTPPLLLVREYRAGRALCMCGCGEVVSLANTTNTRNGHVKGQAVQFVNGGHARWPRRTREARFWEQVDQRGPDECWTWLGYTDRLGYGTPGSGCAHRRAYEFAVGPIPEGLVIDHLCRNPSCVNPSHLEPVTMRENVLRGISISADNARKTHCKRGHPLSGDNLAIRKGNRSCRKCESLYTQRSRAKKEAGR